ncbi:MAG: hypothetical protein GC200_03200 [Tepidisphaera sp.]|nr:hypothetical protein [Tepidisphaera sp.]
MSKQPQDRGLGDHLKEGLKNIPKTYKALYNANHLGPVQTAKGNLKIITTGSMVSGSDGSNKVPALKRAKIAGMGALSVTPLGPIASVVDGISKSVSEKKKAIVENRPENVEKRKLESGQVIKKNVPSMPVPQPKPVNPLRQAQTGVSKPNQFVNKLTPSQNVQPGQKNVMGTKRTPPNNPNKK